MQDKEPLSSRWHKLSLIEQLANIGSEVGRTGKWFEKNKEYFEGAFMRAIELFELTLSDARWNYGQLKEIGRVKEVFCDAVRGGKEYKSSFEDLDKYFLLFALRLRMGV
jgi:hypothetical protein